MNKYIFENLSDIKIHFDKKNKKQILLFLDYDGTLVTFKNNPDQVNTPENVKNILNDLTNTKNLTVVIITGRTLDSIKDLIDNKNIIFSAIHGLIIEFTDNQTFLYKKAKKVKPIIKKIKEFSTRKFDNNKGIFLEDKQFTLALHYRNAPKFLEEKIKNDFIKIVKEFDKENQIELLKGAEVIEARPKSWNKAKAIKKILELSDIKKEFLPIYIGDDTTDEDAFIYLKDKGITIFVVNTSTKSTNAQYTLKDPRDVLRFLEWIKNIRGEQRKNII
jgi:trehalose-phosphatase